LEKQIRKDAVPVKASSRFFAPNGKLVRELQLLRRRRQDLIVVILGVMVMVVVMMMMISISIHLILWN
jgi:hypothetical protein